MTPELMTDEEIVAELIREGQGSLSEEEYAILYAQEQCETARSEERECLQETL